MKTYNKIMKCFFNETKYGENSLDEMGELTWFVVAVLFYLNNFFV